ncbi:YbaB/EbfC family nucleoid-associated protein [Glycomyces sp. NPDC046736]|uniref:YbaB/EbfC family nucleoid-associated protein n=1 Tax=Glycomyces sp. NPDC046736 TaxID=3155615 RepID=UPI0033C0240C
MSEQFPGAAALASFIRSGRREDRTAYRSLSGTDREAYRRLVSAVFDITVVRHFGGDRPAERIERLIAGAAKRHPEYGGSIAVVLRALNGGEEALAKLSSRQLLTAQHLVIREIAKRHPELQVEADQAVAAAASMAAKAPEAPAAQAKQETPAAKAPERPPVPEAPPAPAEPKPPSPADFKLPDSYEAQIAEAKDFLKHIPAGPNLKAAEAILSQAPSREEIKELQRKAAEAQTVLDGVESARFEGSAGAVTVALDATGRIRGLALGTDAVRYGNRELAEAVVAAFGSAERLRAKESVDLFSKASGLGEPGSGDAEILRRIEAFQAERADARYVHTPESGLCRAEADQRGQLTALMFLTGNVARETDRDALAKQIREAVAAAQRAAAAPVAAMTAELLAAA